MKRILIVICLLAATQLSNAQAFKGKGDTKFQVGANLQDGGTGITSTVDFGLGFGMNYFVSSNFSIEAGVAVLGYSTNDNGGNGAEKTNSFEFGGDWRAVTFGVNYKF